MQRERLSRHIDELAREAYKLTPPEINVAPMQWKSKRYHPCHVSNPSGPGGSQSLHPLGPWLSTTPLSGNGAAKATSLGYFLNALPLVCGSRSFMVNSIGRLGALFRTDAVRFCAVCGPSFRASSIEPSVAVGDCEAFGVGPEAVVTLAAGSWVAAPDGFSTTDMAWVGLAC